MCVTREREKKNRNHLLSKPNHHIILLSFAAKFLGVLRVWANQWVCCHCVDRWRWFFFFSASFCMCTGIRDDYILTQSHSHSFTSALFLCVILLRCVWVDPFLSPEFVFSALVCASSHNGTHISTSNIRINKRQRTNKKKRTCTNYTEMAIEIDSQKILTLKLASLPLTERFVSLNYMLLLLLFDSKYSWPFISVNLCHSSTLDPVCACVFIVPCMPMLWPTFVIGHERIKRISVAPEEQGTVETE